MIWLLLAIGLPLALFLLPFALGWCIGLLVKLTPGLKWKIKLSKFLLLWPYKLLDGERHLWVGKEIEWLLRARHGKKDERILFKMLLERLGIAS